MKKILKAAPAATMTLGEFEEAVQARFRDEMMSHFHSAFTETLRRKVCKRAKAGRDVRCQMRKQSEYGS